MQHAVCPATGASEALAGVIQNHMLPLSLQLYGCQVIHKALKVLPREQQRIIVKELHFSDNQAAERGAVSTL